MPFQNKAKIKALFGALLAASAMAACSLTGKSGPTLTLTITPSYTITFTITPTYTRTPTLTITPSPSATATSTSTPSLTPTLAPLSVFATRALREGIFPESYLPNCDYLRLRWSAGASPPGTVVLPIMFHSIAENGTQLADPARDITVEQFDRFVEYAHNLGFETITTQELFDFLTNNAPIPRLSMMIIVDDRRPGLIRDRLLPILDEYDWTATSAYIADPNSFLWAWDLMDQLYATGRLDVQSHGYTGTTYIVPDTPIDKIQTEIWDSTKVLEEHFGVRPIAFIWPGGNFTPQSVKIAREGGYELGFTAYSRGPLLFNWIPLGEEERAVDDPLMVLPRAWSSAANYNMEEAVKISEQARLFAEQNYQVEAEWYRIYCGGELNEP